MTITPVATARIGNAWDELLHDAFSCQSYRSLEAYIDERYEQGTVYPPREQVFSALKLTPPERVRVVIVGQDPYINPNQAQGLAFSVPPGQPLPPSLRNIYQELRDDLGGCPADGCLIPWALQGVLLLNTVLTVEAGLSDSHKGKGWEGFTDSVLRRLGLREQPLAFVLWGAPAQKKESLITGPEHLILKAPHPSPLSAHRGFFGSRPFSRVNAFLTEQGHAPIRWY